MKRILTIAIITINVALLLGWLGFEWFVDDDPLEDSRPGEPKAERSVGALDLPGPVVADLDASEAVVRSDGAPSSKREEGGAAPFDWRSASSAAADQQAAEHLRPVRPVRAKPSESSSPQIAVPAPRPAVSSRPQAGKKATPLVTAEQRAPERAPSREREPSSPTEEKRPEDPSEDVAPPRLDWVRFTPAEVPSGGESVLSAAATDDLAGVREIVGRLSSPSGNAHLGFALSENAGLGTWESVIRVPEKGESGRWQITWLRVTDRANNTKDERWGGGSAPPGAFLLVSSSDGDGTPPLLHNIMLDRQTMGPGESLQISIDVSDEASGVRFVSGTFQSPSGKAWAPFTTSDQGGVWTGPVTVPEDGECGEWKLRRVTAIDEANNQATWGAGEEIVASVAFYRSFTGSCDSEPPVLNRLELSPKIVVNEAAARLEVTAFIDDVGSGVASASGFVMAADPSVSSPQRVHFVLRKSSESQGAPWIGTIEIPQHSMAGRWEVRALRISDEARNQRTYGMADPAMSDGWFMVE